MADTEKRAFRINIVDVLITLMLVAVLSVAAIMLVSAFGVNASAQKDAKTIEYVIQFKGVRTDFDGNIKVGDVIVDAQKRHNLGTVVETPKSTAFKKEVYDEETNTMVWATNEDYITIEVKVQADGYVDDNMYFLAESDKEIGVGTYLYVHTPNFCGSGYVSSMIVK